MRGEQLAMDYTVKPVENAPSVADNGQTSRIMTNRLPVIPAAFPARFIKKIAFRANGCWEWTASTRSFTYKDTRYSYPSYAAGATPDSIVYAHRFAYEALNGPIPSHLEIDHLCQNKICVNPEHLEAVTHRENCKRRNKSGPTAGYRMRWVNGKRKVRS